MKEALFNPWPWYVGGPLIALVMFLLIFMGKKFGMSSNLRALCAAGGAGNKFDFFNYDWKDSSWNLVFALGTIIGGFIAIQFLSTNVAVDLAPSVITDLQQKGFGGCTSGHAISGLSNLQIPSLISVIGFFLGGLIMIHIFFPIIFGQ